MKTKADGSRASRIRAKLRRGESVPDELLSFLKEYDATRGPKGRRAKPITPVSRETVVPEPPIVSVPQMGPMPPPPPTRADQVMVPISFDPIGAPSSFAPSGAPPGSALAPVSTGCTIVNCPCKTGGTGGEFCPTLQKRIYPPMDEDAAKGLAATIMNVIAFVGRFTREDKRYIRPTESEIAKFGRAIRLVQMRRANWAGAWDDLMAFGWAIGAYGMRVINEPSERKKLPTARVSVPSPAAMEEKPAVPEGMGA